MKDDGYWKDVQQAYIDSIIRCVPLKTDDERWEFAKVMTRDRYTMERFIDKAKREGKDYEDVLKDELEERRQRREQKIN